VIGNSHARFFEREPGSLSCASALTLDKLLVHGFATLPRKVSWRLTCEDGSCVMIP
jgi:hypothetical protein